MALSGILNSSLSGLLANQEALRVTSNNVSNANTPGFAKLEADPQTRLAGTQTAGVEIGAVRRVVDEFLNAAVLENNGDSARFEAMRKLHDNLQATLGRPESENSLSAKLNELFTAASELSLDPGDAVTRQEFLSKLKSYTAEASRIAGEIQSLRGTASQRIDEATSEANAKIEQIFELNKKIGQQDAQGSETAGLKNQRQAALEELSAILDIRTVENDNGSVDVRTGNGTTLISQTRYSELGYAPPGEVGAETEFPPIQLHHIDPTTGERQTAARPIDGDIRSGRLRGLLDMRDDQLVDMSLALGELAARVADEVNRVHNLNSQVPAPNTLEGDTVPLAGTAPHNFTGQTTFAVVDGNNEVVDRFTYDFGANPGASLNDVAANVSANLSGGTLSFNNGKMSLSASNADHGVVIAEGQTNPSDRAGRSFSHFFGMNDLLTARSPGLFETGVNGGDAHNIAPGGSIEFTVSGGNGGEIKRVTLDTDTTATFDDVVNALNDPGKLGDRFNVSLTGKGELEIDPKSGRDDLSVQVTSDSTDVAGTGISLSQMFGIGERFRADAARDFRIVEGVPENADRLSTARFDLSAGVGDVALAKGDQTGALALEALQDKVVETEDAGELAGQKRALGAFNNAVLGNFGAIADRVSGAEESSQSLKSELQQRQESVSGVNIDEEMANLVTFQNSYNAAARVLSTVQELFDTLLQTV